MLDISKMSVEMIEEVLFDSPLAKIMLTCLICSTGIKVFNSFLCADSNGWNASKKVEIKDSEEPTKKNRYDLPDCFYE